MRARARVPARRQEASGDRRPHRRVDRLHDRPDRPGRGSGTRSHELRTTHARHGARRPPAPGHTGRARARRHEPRPRARVDRRARSAVGSPRRRRPRHRLRAEACLGGDMFRAGWTTSRRRCRSRRTPSGFSPTSPSRSWRRRVGARSSASTSTTPRRPGRSTTGWVSRRRPSKPRLGTSRRSRAEGRTRQPRRRRASAHGRGDVDPWLRTVRTDVAGTGAARLGRARCRAARTSVRRGSCPTGSLRPQVSSCTSTAASTPRGVTDPTITTTRLILTPLAPRTRTTWSRWWATSNCTSSSAATRWGLEELRARYRTLAAGSGEKAEQWLNWIVRRRVDSQPVGTVQATVTDDPDGSREANVAWVIGVRWQNQGFASEAVVALVDWLRRRGVERVAAHIHPEHRASARVAARAGLEPTTEEIEGEQVWRLESADDEVTATPGCAGQENPANWLQHCSSER